MVPGVVQTCTTASIGHQMLQVSLLTSLPWVRMISGEALGWEHQQSTLQEAETGGPKKGLSGQRMRVATTFTSDLLQIKKEGKSWIKNINVNILKL